MRNIILIVIDTLRADHLGLYGYPRPTSPFLDRLAESSLVLEACYSASNFTAPAFTSLFTATYPTQHGIFDFCSQAGGSAIWDTLRARGMRAEGVVTFRFFKNLLSRIWGDLEVVTDGRSYDYCKDLPEEVSRGAVEWLRRHGRQGPFCLFLHYDAPHVPYRLPPAYAELFDRVAPDDVPPDIAAAFFPQDRERLGRSNPDDPTIRRLRQLILDINGRRRQLDETILTWMIDKYDASVFYNDKAVEQVYNALQELGLQENTVLAVLSDHGEELLDHGLLGHGEMHLYDEVIRTVGIIHDPARPTGRRSALPVSHVQILPTLLRLAGAADLPAPLAGLDVGTAAGTEEAEPAASPVYCEGVFKSAVILGRHKWIQARPYPGHPLLKQAWLWLRMLRARELHHELYDLAQDPTEHHNLARRSELARPLASLLRQHFQQRRPSIPPPSAVPLDEAERARIEKELKDLGYM